MGRKVLGYLLLCAAIVVLGIALYENSKKSQVPLVFSASQILNSTWINYKKEYLEPSSNRTLDKSRNNITTSEGESYTMLRAVWLGDKPTFDLSWTWTKDNLQHKTGDKLFSWLFGNEGNGTYGILTSQGGNNTASDADTDIALSLIFAYSRWQDKAYLGDARLIIADIWNNDVVEVNGTPYLAADNVEKTSSSTEIAIDPSYFNPAAYKIFAKFDPTHPWQKLADSSYAMLGEVSGMNLGSGTSAGLPPDWVMMNRATGALSAPQSTTNTANFGYDAMRIPWRLALDYQWNKDPRALSVLKSYSFLANTWEKNGSIASIYAHNGSVVTASESPSIYGGTIGYFMLADTKDAQNVYQQKLQYLYDPGQNGWKQVLSYYDDNWAWFGIALYNDLLPNLTAGLPQSAYQQ